MGRAAGKDGVVKRIDDSRELKVSMTNRLKTRMKRKDAEEGCNGM